MSVETTDWIPTAQGRKPPEDVVVVTCVMVDGLETKYRLLAWSKSKGWHATHGTIMYIPTHWKEIPKDHPLPSA